MSRTPRRIAVVGRSGAGKTTVALLLADALRLPVIHLDHLYWDPGWVQVTTAEFESRQAAATSGEDWVIDGSYLASPGWMDRVRRADAIVLVEAPLLVCVARIIRRSLQRGPARRSDLPEGCDEHLSGFLLWWTLGWRIRHRGLESLLRRTNPDARLIVVKRGDDRHLLVGRLSADDPQ